MTAMNQIQRTDGSKYELEFLRCSPQTDEEYRESKRKPSIGGDMSRSVIAIYRVTNLDSIRRRFDIRAHRVDALGARAPFLPQHSNRLDPGESSVEQLSMRQLDADVAPYRCSAEVWDSVLDLAFPDD